MSYTKSSNHREPTEVLPKLSKQELARIDKLLKSARWFHYASFVMAGLSLVISSLDHPEAITLPIVDISLPGIHASVAIYFIALVMAICAESLFSMSYPWLKLDPRRPPFAWIALGSEISYKRVTIWIIAPAFFCAIFTSFYLQDDYVGMGLLYGSLGAVLLPRTFKNYRMLLSAREDHRGGPATYSIYLLYWYRLFRYSLVTFGLLLAVFAVIPKWRYTLLEILLIFVMVFVVTYIVRVIGGIPFVYRKIDSFGKRYGFPTKSPHYQ